MDRETCLSLLADLSSLTFFCSLRKKPPVKNLEKLLRFLLSPGAGNPEICFRLWAAFVRSVADTPSFSFRLAEYILEEENLFTLGAEKGSLSPRIKALAASDFLRLQKIASLDIKALALALKEKIVSSGFAAGSPESAESLIYEAAALNMPLDPKAQGDDADNMVLPQLSFGIETEAAWAGMENFAAWIAENGAGLMGRFGCFRWVTGGGREILEPVLDPDPVRFSDLSGYRAQLSLVIENTRRFAEGKPANNLLLYGDRGTGKSAAVKASANEFRTRGLRLIEIRKELLPALPALMAALSGRGLKFIIFVDDLSFEVMDDSFTDIKALLEGGVERRPANTVIYATSNRRHLVREAGQERPLSGAPRDFDTLQGQLSLADRFGLTIIYASPDQEEFLEIAEFIACRRGILDKGDTSPEGEERRSIFRENALRWERWFNGRSPRTAVQYVDWIQGGEGFPWQ